jgi:ABC-type multidrug transport system ATPase subunit
VSGTAVVAETLTRRFGDVAALDGVSFDVRSGELFGFVGPDGGGKTTLMRILVTLLVPDAGRASVLGLDVVRDLWTIRRRVGYMPGRFSLYPDLSVEENLQFFASVFGTTVDAGMATIAPIYDQLAPFASRRAGALSGGMKQKLALSCALVHHPDILFLDEPTTGVDAVSRREFWNLLTALRAGGLTIVVSTPYMDEAARCDRVALIQRGRLLGIDAPSSVARSFRGTVLEVRSQERYRALLALRTFEHTDTVHLFGESLHYTDRRAGGGSAEDIRAYLRTQGIESDVTAIAPTIEDTFIQRMGAPEAA